MRTVAPRLARVALGVVLVVLPFATAVLAIAWSPPSHVDIAGAPVAVKPVLGQDTSRLQNGALVRADHGTIPLLGKAVGVDIDADWNRLIPSDKQTRGYLVQLWDDPAPEIRRIQDTARDHLVEWGAGGFAAGLLVECGLLLVLLQRRRRLASYSVDEARLVRDHNRRLRFAAASFAVVVALVVDAAGARVWAHDDDHVVVGDPQFAGTTLQGTEANGLVSDILPFLSILQPRNGFYDRVARHLDTALAADPGLQPGGDRVRFVLAEDFEDVNGMARQVGYAAKLVDADFLLLTGDLTFAGKPIESYIIDTVNYYSDDRPVYFAPGLHDTDAIVHAAQARGWHVADGSTMNVGGLTLLPLADPRISTVGDFGTGDVLRDPDVGVDAFVTDAQQRICADRPDFVALHDHLLGRQLAATGCQRRAVLDGRSYDFVGPTTISAADGGEAVEYTSGSGGGHVSTQPDPGQIQHPARFSILTCDPDGRHVRYYVVTVDPDASVTVTPGISLHVPYADYLADGQTRPDGTD